jgi:hypothetical protein
MNWQTVQPDQIASFVNEWWEHPLLTTGDTLPGAYTVAPSAAHATPLSAPELRGQVDLMLAHLNEALFALSSNNADLAGSWFRRFSDRWDGSADTIRGLYTDQYSALEADRQNAAIALFQTSGADLEVGRAALRELRDRLLDIANDLDRSVGSVAG